MKPYYSIAAIFSLLVSQLSAADSNPFPLRIKYSDVPTIAHEDVYRLMSNDSAIIIDVRSDYEYGILRVKNAINIPISNQGFIPRLEEIRQTDSRQIIFYCNGITCSKSYKACRKASTSGIADVVAFDLGVFGWTNAHPDAAVLLGESPVPLSKLISTELLNSHMLSPTEFEQKINAGQNQAMVIDIRDPFQRNVRLFEGRTRRIPLDRINLALDRAKKFNKTLLIFDAVGKQVRWLQYVIENRGISDYFFMKGGVREYMAN